MDDALSALSEAAAAALPAVAHLLPSSIAGHHEQGDDSPTDSSSNSAQAGVECDMAEVTVKREARAEDKDSNHRDAPPSSPSILHHQSSDTALHQREDVRLTAILPVAASSTATSELHSLAANRTDLAVESSKKEGQHVNGSPNTIASDAVASASHTENISSSAPNGAPPASFSTRSPEENFSTNTTSSSTKSVDGDTHSSNLKRPFSRVDVLLEAAASPLAPSPAKQIRIKKSPKSTSSGTNTPSKDSATQASTTMAMNGAASNASAAPSPSTTATASSASHSSRKSAYQGPKISMACFSCRSSKTRCSGTAPCNRCESKRMECHYPLKDGRTANRTSLQTLSAVSSMASSQDSSPAPTSSLPSILPSVLPQSGGYEPGPMQRFNQAFAYSNSSSSIAYRNTHSPAAATASRTAPSVSAHQALSSASSARQAPFLSVHDSYSTHHQFPRPLPSEAFSQQQQQQHTSPSNHSQDADSGTYRPSSGGSTISRTHMSLPLNNTGMKSSSKSPEEFHYFSSIDRADRLSASHPSSSHAGDGNSNQAAKKNERPATAGAQNGYGRTFSAKEEENRFNSTAGRDRSRSFPHPVPLHLQDYVPGLLPSLSNSVGSSALGSARDANMEEGHSPDHRFLEGTSKMKDTNALQLKEHRRPANAHPEASAFGESDPAYKPQQQQEQPPRQGLPYPSSSAYLPFTFGVPQHRFSPHQPSLSPHHLRQQNGYAPASSMTVKSVVKQESEEASPRIDELSESPATFERSELTDAASDLERSSRTSPPSTAGTSLSLSLQSSTNSARKADVNLDLVGPAYLHRNNILPSILGTKSLPDTLLPWADLLRQAGIPDLETLKAEIPFEAVKRYVDCLAESWPDVLPTFTKRFQLRYAIEDALTRACHDAAPVKAIEQ